MSYAITYTPNVNAMVAKGLALVAAGKYPRLISKTEEGKLNFHAFFCPVAYKDNASIGYGTLSLVDIQGDEETGEAGFLSDMGLICLNHGANGIGLYDGMTPENKALYESIKPPIKLLDIEGNETGETRFNYHTVIDGGY